MRILNLLEDVPPKKNFILSGISGKAKGAKKINAIEMSNALEQMQLSPVDHINAFEKYMVRICMYYLHIFCNSQSSEISRD